MKFKFSTHYFFELCFADLAIFKKIFIRCADGGSGNGGGGGGGDCDVAVTVVGGSFFSILLNIVMAFEYGTPFCMHCA